MSLTVSSCLLRCIRSIWKSINCELTTVLVNSLVLSRLDYCIAAHYGLPKSTLQRLQRVLHAAARLVTGLRKCTMRSHHTCAQRSEVAPHPIKNSSPYLLSRQLVSLILLRLISVLNWLKYLLCLCGPVFDHQRPRGLWLFLLCVMRPQVDALLLLLPLECGTSFPATRPWQTMLRFLKSL